MKRMLSFFLSLLLVVGCGIGTASAAQGDGLTVSFKTAIYSISKETFVRWTSERASLDECGEDEYITVCAVLTNPSAAAVTLRSPYIQIDGGEKLRWANDITLKTGESAWLHVYYSRKNYLTSGLHTAALYASDGLLASGHFSIGRDWTKVFKFPTEAQIAARAADERSPYLSAWLDIDKEVRYNAYCVDFKSDYIPYSTYSCLFNGYMDLSGLKQQYRSVEGSGLFYGGLQRGDVDKGSNFILSFWDIFCTDAAGKKTTIRAKRTYPVEKTNDDDFGHEGTGAHTLLPYDWQAGRWYRMLLQCGTSETTGNTTVEQWFQDLTTNKWTHVCTYDTGLKNSCFVGSTALFSENFGKKFAAGVRSLEFTNVRIHTNEGWNDVNGVRYIYSRTTGIHEKAYGSWEAGADGNTFYMISTGVPGWGRKEMTGALTIRNRESGNPRQK